MIDLLVGYEIEILYSFPLHVNELFLEDGRLRGFFDIAFISVTVFRLIR